MPDYLPGQPLSRKLSKKYAMAVRKFELGIWCCKDLNLLKAVYLTTWDKAMQTQGKYKGMSKNNRLTFMQDLRELKRRLIAEGIGYESCFCLEYSSISNLLHAHGFVRLKKYVSSKDLHNIISKIWGDVHDSPVVWVKDIYSIDNIVKYVLKDAVKNYLSEIRLGGRLLCSRGWLPEGWREVQKMIVEWYLIHKFPDWVKSDEEVNNYLDEFGNNNDGESPVYLAKEIMKDLIYRWCSGEVIILEYKDRKIYIQGKTSLERMESENE